MRNERELPHNWVGRPGRENHWVFNCRDRKQAAFMDIELAAELPYCPFCRKDIEYRPRSLGPEEGE